LARKNGLVDDLTIALRAARAKSWKKVPKAMRMSV